jgi:hypothetical protein
MCATYERWAKEVITICQQKSAIDFVENLHIFL